MNNSIRISYINDFIFCPVSIYFHNLYGNIDKEVYEKQEQLIGSYAHKTIDQHTYSNKKAILQGSPVYSNRYNLSGNIDLFDIEKGLLIERKNKVHKIYEGYILQLYAQYYCLIEMGYVVKQIKIYSYCDNKSYSIALPDENIELRDKFCSILNQMNHFDLQSFIQTNGKKCRNCIYREACDRGLE